MSDLIDRQVAIDAIRASTSKYTGFMEMEMYTDDDAVEAIAGLPSVQPDAPDICVGGKITTNSGTPITRWGYASPHQTVVGNIEDSLEEKISEMLKHLAPPEYTELRCRECGGAIDQKWDDHIVKCPYCKTVYVVGRKMLNG